MKTASRGRWVALVGIGLMAFMVGQGTAYAQEVVLKLWDLQAAGHIRHQATQVMAKRIAELSGGGMRLDLFPGGMMGDSIANLEGLKLGTNDFALEDPGLISTFDPTKRVAVLQLPYLVDTYEQAWEFVDSEVVSKLFDHLPEAAGMRVVSIWQNGLRHLTNSKRPITHPRDLQGLKIRVVKDPVMLEVMKTLGASPVPMGFAELYTSLQHGVVDGQENPIPNIYFAKFFEVQKYMSLSAHQYSTIPLVMSEITWRKLTPERRQIVVKAAAEAKVWLRTKLAADEPGLLQELKGKGMTVNTVDTKPFREAVAGVYKQFEPTFGKETVERVLEAAGKARAKFPAK